MLADEHNNGDVQGTVDVAISHRPAADCGISADCGIGPLLAARIYRSATARRHSAQMSFDPLVSTLDYI